MTTINKAVDRLADALAGADQAKGATIAETIDKLAAGIESGDISIGGGADSGQTPATGAPVVYVPIEGDSESGDVSFGNANQLWDVVMDFYENGQLDALGVMLESENFMHFIPLSANPLTGSNMEYLFTSGVQEEGAPEITCKIGILVVDGATVLYITLQLEQKQYQAQVNSKSDIVDDKIGFVR